MVFERTWTHFMRSNELVIRGGLVIDVADSHPLEFPEVAPRLRLRVIWSFLDMVYETRVSCFYWANGLNVCEHQHILSNTCFI